MKTFNHKLEKHVDLLMERSPQLECVREDFINAYLVMEEIAGNGGSSADSEHIAGGLM